MRPSAESLIQMFFRFSSILSILSAAAYAQSGAGYVIEPFAGAPRSFGDDGAATSALLWSPRGVSVDAAGNLYIADTGNARIRKVDTRGMISTVAGSSAGFSGDGGPAAGAQFSFPTKVVVTPNGDLYVADTGNNRIRRISGSGTVSTVAGTGTAGFNGDSVAGTSVNLSFPYDVSFDPNGNVIIADSSNSRIRRLTQQGRIDTIAGSGVFGIFGDDGPAARASFAFPRGVAADRVGNIYVADTFNNRIRRIGLDGTVTTLAGGNSPGFGGDFGQAAFSQLNHPTGIAVDSGGNIYFADSLNHRVRRITPQGVITTIAGGSTNGFAGDNGRASAALLNSPQSVAVDTAGNVYIADTDNHRIRKVNTQGIITTVAGSDPGAGDGGPALPARLFQPSGVARDPAGNLYVSDMANHRVRRISLDGSITTAAGNGSAGYSGDNGSGLQAQLNGPNGLAFDRSGALYIADTGNHVIRRLAGGVITTVAGTGTIGNSGDTGPAREASLFNPSAVAFDRAGNMYIADSANNRIRIVSPAGIIQHFAGDPAGRPGFSGDGGPAAAGRFDYPIALAFDDTGNLYVSDYFNNRIRRVSTSSTLTTFAGNGARGSAGDGGPATQAQLALPAGLAFDAERNLYIADLLNNRIRAVTQGGIITAVAGTGLRADSGDGGTAVTASLASPRDIVIDPQGNIYFSDQDNNRIRKLTASAVAIRIIVNAASGTAGPIAAGEALTIYGTQLGSDVRFDGIPAAILYASPNQVNVIVPEAIAGRQFSQVQVFNGGLSSANFTLTVREAVPGIFTLDNSGRGQAAVINEDGTVNGPAHPAPPGSIVAIYGTGQGALQTATVRIQGALAEVLYAGPAPQSVGLFQVNVQIPSNVVPSNAVPIDLAFGVFSAQAGATIVVR